MVMEVALLEAIELRIALQWLRSSIGDVIAEAGVPSMCVLCYRWHDLPTSRWRYEFMVALD